MANKRLDPNLRGVLTNPNEISEELLAELRRAATDIEAHGIFSHYADAACRPYALSFVLDVVFGGMDARTWRRGGVLIPAWNLVEMLTRPTEELLAPLGNVDATRRLMVLPADRDGWEQGAHSTGAPAMVRPDLNYEWRGGPNVVRLSRATEGTPIGDLEPTVRRWIATRLAMVLRQEGRLFDVKTPDEMFKVAGIEPQRATAGATGAGCGLLQEIPHLRGDPTLVPGFVASDDAYMEA